MHEECSQYPRPDDFHDLGLLSSCLSTLMTWSECILYICYNFILAIHTFFVIIYFILRTSRLCFMCFRLCIFCVRSFILGNLYSTPAINRLYILEFSQRENAENVCASLSNYKPIHNSNNRKCFWWHTNCIQGKVAFQLHSNSLPVGETPH